MTNDRMTCRAYITGGVTTASAHETSLAIDMRLQQIPRGPRASLEFHLDPPPPAPCRVLELRDGGDRSYGAAYAGPTGGYCVRLNDVAIADLRAAFGAFFFLHAVLVDDRGTEHRLPALPRIAIVTRHPHRRTVRTLTSAA